MCPSAYFEDENGKLNRSAVELGYSALVVSNFTLYGDTAKGKRPSFIHAAKGELAVPCYENSWRRWAIRASKTSSTASSVRT